MRLWLLTNSPSPYQVEFFHEIHRSGLFTLDVRFMTGTHRGVNVLAETDIAFPHVALRGIGARQEEYQLHPQAIREVAYGAWDLYILSGHYTSPTVLACGLAAMVKRKKWVLWLERPWPPDYRPRWCTRLSVRYPILQKPREWLLKTLAKGCHGIFCIGTGAIRAYEALGVPRDKLFFLPYYCDVEKFSRVEKREIARLLAQKGFLEKTVFLYSGALILRKGVDLLIRCFKILAAERKNVALFVLGDGPLRESLVSSIPFALSDRICFAGHIPQPDLPTWFGASDVFVFPSRYDGWGVVLNEACAAGLPIVTTNAVGAAEDLVVEGQNGFIIPRDDGEALLDRMKRLVDDPDLRQKMGSQSRVIAQAYTLRAGVSQLWKNIEAVLNRK